MSHPIVAITGGSGSVYGTRLLEVLIALNLEPYVVVSPAGRQVMAVELGSGDLKDHLGTTGYREEMGGVVEKGLQIGAYSCLYKPFEVEQLIGTIDEISKRKLREVLGEPF